MICGAAGFCGEENVSALRRQEGNFGGNARRTRWKTEEAAELTEVQIHGKCGTLKLF